MRQHIDLTNASAEVRLFAELSLMTIMLHCHDRAHRTKRTKGKDESRLARIFAGTREVPERIESLRALLGHMADTDLTQNAGDLKIVRWGCTVADRALSVALASGSDDEEQGI